MSAKNDYDITIKEATGNTGHMLNGTCYYDYDYLKSLLNNLGQSGIKTFYKELSPSSGFFPMCSVASSARLAYLYFSNKNVETNNSAYLFEAYLPIKNDNGKKITAAQPDAYTEGSNPVFYECKCHEIFDTHKPFTKVYKSLLKNTFDIDSQLDGSNLQIFQKDIGISGELSIYNMKVDVKQMLCHLLGIITKRREGGFAKDGVVTLQYVFFISSKTHPIVEKILNEFHAIQQSLIVDALKKYKIKLPDPLFIEVGSITDFVYEDLMGKH